ncbi:hypothetical protein PMY35_07315 [Clostridium tertium]|uniref:hypothetical protein n=1 Tax=Clostridium tertium TaxID=1559 RepID=UPI00189FB470|nr:hypothetical protein [Clostridium tertium]MDB1947627.1 hypothetical protein [Clostridium tertium]
MEEELLEKYGIADSDYLVKYCNENKIEHSITQNVSSKNYTIKCFETSKELKEIKKYYGNIKIKLKVSNPLSQVILDMKTMKYYDSDENEILIKDKNKYRVYLFHVLNESNNIERLTLNEYIEAVRNIKALQRYKHYLIMDYNNDEVQIIFGEDKVITTDGYNEMEKDHFLFEKYIDQIYLKMQ